MEFKRYAGKNRSDDLRPLTADIFRTLIPEQSVEYILDWFLRNKVTMRISMNRASKTGDYRPSRQNLPARISVNNNLNPYDFLITLLHEMAHHDVWLTFLITRQEFSSVFHRRFRQPKPHGREWQNHFRRLMAPVMNTAVFPPDVLYMIENYFSDHRVSAKYGHHLLRALKKYDKPDGREFIENLPYDALFSLPDGRTFRRKEKLRKRYRCICMNNNRIYLFSPLAQVYQGEK